jgi:hypothetical protein
VLLIVLLVLLTATAMASVSLQATQGELRAAGNQRVGVQTQFASEAAMATTLAWVDATSLTGEFYTTHMLGWNAQPAPLMSVFGEPEISAGNRAFASRSQWQQQRSLLFETAPLTVRGGTVAGPAGAQVPDPIGSFGPLTQYVPGFQTATAPEALVDYVVDMYDCQLLPVTASAGSLINDIGSGVPAQFQVYCVVTSRGRSYVPTAGALTRSWTLAGGAVYVARRFSAAQDSRGTLISPPILQ